jgi:hypothetical protein
MAASISVSVTATVLTIALAFLAAYGMARSYLRNSRTIIQAFLILASLPVMAYIIPLSDTVRNFRLYDTFVGVALANPAIFYPACSLYHVWICAANSPRPGGVSSPGWRNVPANHLANRRAHGVIRHCSNRHYVVRAQLESIARAIGAYGKPCQDYPGGNERFLYIRTRYGMAGCGRGVRCIFVACGDPGGDSPPDARKIPVEVGVIKPGIRSG